jgi:hypothetical protein
MQSQWTFSGYDMIFFAARKISVRSWCMVPRQSLSRISGQNRVNIDTGAYTTARLTCLVLVNVRRSGPLWQKDGRALPVASELANEITCALAVVVKSAAEFRPSY